MSSDQIFGLLLSVLVVVSIAVGAMLTNWIKEQDHRRYLERQAANGNQAALDTFQSSGITWVRDDDGSGMAHTEVEPPVDPRRIPGASSTPPAMDYDG